MSDTAWIRSVLLAVAVIYVIYQIFQWRKRQSYLVLAKASDLKNGQMKEVTVGTNNKVLLIKDKDSFSAVGSKCSHYGAPLVNGAYSNGKIRCPWHGACFNTKTGDIEDFPTCSGIPTYPVRVEGGNVVMSPDALKKTFPALPAYKPGAKDTRVFVIIGAGAAGATAAMQLRKEGFSGRVVLIGAETHVAYDRPKLSKALGIEVDKITLYKKADYAAQQIDLLLGKKVTSLDYDTRTVKLDDDQVISYDACLIATGAQPMRLERFIKNNDVPRANVHVLRNVEEATAIGDAYIGKDVVIIGSSFIGMETAAAVVKKAKSVVIIGMEKVPFERVLGLEVGGVMQKLHEREGIQFKMEATCKEFTLNSDNTVASIILADGTVLPCDLVVIGAGAFPTTDFVKEGGAVKIERDRSIVVDTYLETGAPGLFAAGDLARFPLPLLDNDLVRIEHWGIAMTHGKIAAKNMLGRKKAFTNIPFFWTAQHGKNVRYCGHGVGVDTTLVDTRGGKMYTDDPAFVVFYGRRGKVVAVASLGADPVVAEVAQLLTDGVEISIDELRQAVSDHKSAAYISAKLHPNLSK